MIGIGSIGPAGERGKTGDHGQRGDTGETGEAGEAGQTGYTGAIGAQGPRGKQGPAGLRGKALTWIQALAMFLFVVLAMTVLSIGFERQQRVLERQQVAVAEAQARIEENSRKITEDRYLGCLGGVRIIETYNAQMRELAKIERDNPSPVAKQRIKAYESGLIKLPDPACRR